ncbi:UNVERIFIED_ORG: hypothetical protein L601_002300000560 [Gordonia westfalica J30]
MGRITTRLRATRAQDDTLKPWPDAVVGHPTWRLAVSTGGIYSVIER